MRWHLGRYAVLRALPVLLLLVTMPASAQTTDTNLYIHCSFYPQGDGCERVYQQALRDQGPLAASVRDAFKYYARYLSPASAGLTDDDRRYLAQNQIRMPFELNALNLAGLHNVLTDPALVSNATARRMAVNGFITRAVQAELYCGTTNCRDEGSVHRVGN